MAGSSLSVRKGAWTEEEDNLLRKCIDKYGEENWHQVPVRAGLNRCRKSCRLRWVNYLKPDIKRGGFEADEVDLILRLHKLLGNRWALIAGRLPGRTANGIKNYWNTYLRKRPLTSGEHAKEKGQKTQSINIIRPRPRIFSKRLSWMKGNASSDENDIQLEDNLCKASAITMNPQENETVWWESLLAGMDSDQEACDSMGCSGGKGMENLFIRTGNYSPPGTTMGQEYYSNTSMNSSGDFSLDMNLWNLFNSDETNP